MAAVSTASAAESFPVRENSTAINLDDTIEGEDVNGSPKAKLEAADSNVSSGTLRASGGAAGAAAKKTDKEKKIGHRRVDEEGQITYKKIQTSQIMSSIQLGIAHAVGSLASKPERDLLMQDFAVVETVYFAKEGSQHTPAHHNQDFRFKIYAPMAFRYFRDLFGIQPDDFLVSMCDSPLKELSNAGASGSIFYLTIDDEFIVKTVQHKEAEFLQKLLPGYYMNLNQNPRTLLPKFFGLYCYQCNSKNVRLIVMNNLLPSSIRYHQKYDLKGSTYKRKANKYERNKKSPTYKDLDFIEHHTEGLMLEAETYCALMKTIQRDCRVLESFKIMDYSLLVGIHNLDQAAKERALRHSPSPMTENPGNDGLKMQKRPGAGDSSSAVVDTEPYPSHSAAGQQQQHHYHHHRDGPVSLDVPSAMNASYFGGGGGAKSGPALTRSKSLNRQRLVAHSTAMESIQAQSEPIDEDDNVPPGGIPARNAQGERLLVFLGIIDILQSYRLKKRLEHTFKSVIHDGDSVSVHNPTFYSERFRSFMEKKVFKKIPSPLKHSPSKKKTAAAVKLKPSEFEHGEAESAGLSHVEHHRIKGFNTGDALPIGSTPPPGFDEAIRGGPNNMYPTSSPSRSTYYTQGSTAHSVRSQSTYSSNSSTVTSRQEIETTVRLSQMTVQSKASPGRGGPRHTAAAVAGADGTMGRGSAWTPPLSSNDNTTWTEGTPSYTESSSSEGHTPRRSRNASRESDKRRGLDELDEESPQHVTRL